MLGVDQPPEWHDSHDSHESQSLAQRVQFLLASSVADAGSHKELHHKKSRSVCGGAESVRADILDMNCYFLVAFVIVEPTVRFTLWRDKIACFKQQQNLLASSAILPKMITDRTLLFLK